MGNAMTISMRAERNTLHFRNGRRADESCEESNASQLLTKSLLTSLLSIVLMSSFLHPVWSTHPPASTSRSLVGEVRHPGIDQWPQALQIKGMSESCGPLTLIKPAGAEGLCQGPEAQKGVL